MYFVYLLKLQNGQFYTGFSENLKVRIKRHSESSTTTTKRLAPDKLVFYAAFNSKYKALKFERYLKSSSGFAFRNKHFI